MENLADRDIRPPLGRDTPPLSGVPLETLSRELDQGWSIIEEHHLERDFVFKNFMDALEFTIKISELADAADHHPEICLSWGSARVTIWTHSIGGLSEADFVLAAKSDRIYLTSG